MKRNQLKSLRQTIMAVVLLLVIIAGIAGFMFAPGVVQAEEGGLMPDDPMVKINSMPIDKDIDEVLAGISEDVSQETGLDKKLITYYWQNISHINCMGEKVEGYPVLVDLYVPGFFTQDQIAQMMCALANAIAKRSGVDKKWIFIQTHFPRQGGVYINEQVSTWDNYQGQ